jgi:hypothetical protein
VLPCYGRPGKRNISASGRGIPPLNQAEATARRPIQLAVAGSAVSCDPMHPGARAS